MLSALQEWIDWLDRPFLNIGGFDITILLIIQIVVLPIIVYFFAKGAKSVMVRVLRKNPRLDEGVRNATASIFYYVLLVIGLVWAFETAGFDMTGVAIFSGGVGIGLGIGLQDVARNFISGMVLLIARPIKPGDRIEIDGLEANVEAIGTYSTKVQTVQDATVIVPNSDLLNARLINWTHNAARRMFFVPVGVHYASDVDLVMKTLVDAAIQSEDILAEPRPEVFLTGFGDSSINFEVAVWTENHVFRPKSLISQYNVEVARLFQARGIVIPYPQRDVHLYEHPTK